MQVSSTTFEQLEHSYTLVAPGRVSRFLDGHPFLAPLLLETRERIEEFFPASRLFLSIMVDPEIAESDTEASSEEVVLSIATRLAPGEAMDRLDQFDAGWWLGALPRAQGKLVINLAFQ